jgi:hypothetical protein
MLFPSHRIARKLLVDGISLPKLLRRLSLQLAVAAIGGVDAKLVGVNTGAPGQRDGGVRTGGRDSRLYTC